MFVITFFKFAVFGRGIYKLVVFGRGIYKLVVSQEYPGNNHHRM